MTTPDPYRPSQLDDTPHGRYTVSIRDIGVLVRTTPIINPADLVNGPRDPDLTVTTSEVTAWIEQLTGRLDAMLTDLDRVNTASSTYTSLVTSGRDAIANGVASYIEAAGHPEQAATAESSYATVLWDRWQTITSQLRNDLAAALDANGPGVGPPTGRSAAAWSFPPPALPDNKRW